MPESKLSGTKGTKIFCEKNSHKGIIVGKNGASLKLIGTYAREDLEKLFGTTPEVGDKVTLMQVFQKTLKSKAEIDRAVKNWQEKGIIVEFKAAANQLESTYEIKKLA